jgi:hypothetical protein
MIPEIREAIRTGANNLMTKEGLTWDSIHRIDIKEKLNSPVSGRTIYRICKKNSEHTTTKKNMHKILTYFNIAYSENYGVFQLIKIPTNEATQ